jgi:hypothetical protein
MGSLPPSRRHLKHDPYPCGFSIAVNPSKLLSGGFKTGHQKTIQRWALKEAVFAPQLGLFPL